VRDGDQPSSPSLYPRPVPAVGDQTSAAERAADPAGWAMPPGVREALHDVMLARRDVRRYRPDPVPPGILRRVLQAAHAAPSVGHSQPWRFIVVSDSAARDRAALLADRERARQADRLTPDRRRRLLDLYLEGIREAPLGIVVACDRRAPAAGVLGRATFPDADLWSCACAIQNLWLAARAEGLGTGWVTLFRPEDLAELVGIPGEVETLGWLCLGWPDERPPGPGLERAGWSARLPLEAVVLQDRWPREAPPAPASHLNTGDTGAAGDTGSRAGAGATGDTGAAGSRAGPGAAVQGPTRHAVAAVRDAADNRLCPPEALGLLDRYTDKVLALAGGRPAATGGTLVLVGADHPVAALGVSAYRPSVTGDVLRASVAGQSLGAVAAREAGLDVVVVDARPGTAPVPGALHVPAHGARGDLARADALAPGDAAALLETGRRLGAERARLGLVALGEVGVGNTTVAAALTAALLGLPAEASVGLGAGADTAMLAAKTAVVRAALTRAARSDGRGPLKVLAALGGADVAVLTGVTLGAAAAGVPVVLDGLLTSVAALVAVRLEPGVARMLVAGHRSREAAHGAVLTELGLEPLLDLRLRAGEGVGACLAVSLLRHGAALRHDVARTRTRTRTGPHPRRPAPRGTAPGR
jgi:nicotinate-nucleotide--dimethylbenzimidazole phosphoribosyltransferase